MNIRNIHSFALAAMALFVLAGASESRADPCSASASTLVLRSAGGNCSDALTLNQEFLLRYRITNASIVDDPGGPNDGTPVAAEIPAGRTLIVTLAQETAAVNGPPLPGTLAFVPVCGEDSTGGTLSAGDACDPSNNQCGTGACGCLTNVAGITCTQNADPNKVNINMDASIAFAPNESQLLATLRVKTTDTVSPPAQCGVFFTRVDATGDILVTDDELCSNPVTAGARGSTNLNAPECTVDTDCGDTQCNQCADVGTDNHCAVNVGNSCGSDADPNDCVVPACVDQEGTGVCVQGQDNEPPGTSCESDSNICTDDQCDANGTCVHLNNTDPCDDASECTTNDTCSNGSCVGGPPPDCNDGNVCTNDSCNPATPGGCVHTNNTLPCSDGDECTTGDTCSGGTCVGGPPPDCDDENVCTNDSCNPATLGGCVHTNNTLPCSDGSECTTGDTCSGGTCVGGPPPNCNDGNVCTNDSCNPAVEGGCVHANNTDPCDDASQCTTNDTCSNGSCVGGPPPNCNDSNVCTDDSCNPAVEGGCVHANNTAPCDDDSECTTGDTCSGGACVGGPPPDCDDSNVCTNDSCNPATEGGCVHTNNTGPCSDGSECTTGDVCSGGTCVGGPPPDCNDANVCTTDTCNPATEGGCVHTNNTEPCSDENQCTTGDTCSGGTCVGGPAPNCNDSNVCTNDSCNPSTEGGCVHTNNTEPCSDGSECTTGDTCSNGSCVGGPPPDCDDDNVCTTDSCNPATAGGCVHANNTAQCDDGAFCTVNDTCSGGSCGGSARNCGDSVSCTTDACSEATDRCTHTRNDAACNDGLFCNGDETCNAETGCVPGTPVSCGDEVACTVDACNEDTHACESVPDDDLCADDDSCTFDTCDAESGCHHEFSCRDICRPSAFYGKRAGFNPDHLNVVQSILDAVGGLEVCGQTVTETSNDTSPYLEGLGLDSALEGLCVRVQGVTQRPLYRELVTTALNCAISGSDDCDAVVSPFIDASFSECDALCTSGDVGPINDKSSLANECIRQLRCYNRGGQMFGDKCALGNCSLTGQRCGADYGLCPPVVRKLVTYMQACERFIGNCYESDFCQPALDVCPSRTPATSKAACKEAKSNACTIDSCE